MTRRLVIRKQLHDVAMTLTRCALQRSPTHNILQTCVRMTLEKLPNHSYVPSSGCQMQRGRTGIVLGIHIRAMLDEHLIEFYISAPDAKCKGVDL